MWRKRARQDGDVHAQAAVWGDNGSGMHVHQSLWKDGKTLMADANGYAGLSQTRQVLHRRPVEACARAAGDHVTDGEFVSPTGARLSKHPSTWCIRSRNRSAAVRIPMYSENPKAKRIEFRCPDPTAIRISRSARCCWPVSTASRTRSIRANRPITTSSNTRTGCPIKQVPGSLPEALAALEADHKFLLAGDVFTQDVIDTWIEMKRTKEIDPIRLRPHPYEFYLYYDA